jgi:hypothetical protein
MDQLVTGASDRSAHENDTIGADPAAPGFEPLVGATRFANRRRYDLQDTGFDEVPKRMRRFYRRWGGDTDVLAPNEVVCPVCKVVIRSTHELRPGDRVFCLPCMSRLVVIVGDGGRLEGRTLF